MDEINILLTALVILTIVFVGSCYVYEKVSFPTFCNINGYIRIPDSSAASVEIEEYPTAIE